MNTPTSNFPSEPIIYQGQFGDFTITQGDRQGVLVYRGALLVAAISLASGVGLALGTEHSTPEFSAIQPWLTALYGSFWLALGVSLLTIHIYLAPLHRLLQVFWGIGGLASGILALQHPDSLALYIYDYPLSLLGVGFTFAALTGIFFKEAFCFDRLETKFLTLLVPLLLLGHLVDVLPLGLEQGLLGAWAVLFLIFALRKVTQPIPDDIGDKSVFDYLKSQRTAKA